MEEDAVRTVLLPRTGARASQVRSTRLEHSVRVQRIRPQDQCPTDAGKRASATPTDSYKYLNVSNALSSFTS